MTNEGVQERLNEIFYEAVTWDRESGKISIDDWVRMTFEQVHELEKLVRQIEEEGIEDA